VGADWKKGQGLLKTKVCVIFRAVIFSLRNKGREEVSQNRKCGRLHLKIQVLYQWNRKRKKK